MQVIIDKGIPFFEGVFPPEIEVLHLSPKEITSQSVRNADALIVRTRTCINRDLFQGSRVRFVATATIGFDHIDQDYCREAGIHWVSCPGCNAQAVCDYVEEAISSMKSDKTDLTIGIIGYGHVGKLVAKMAQRRGYRVLLSDPPWVLEFRLRNLHLNAMYLLSTPHSPTTAIIPLSTSVTLIF